MKTFSIKLLLTAFLLQIFSASFGQLTAIEKEKLKNARIMLVRYEAPPLYIMSPKDVAGKGLIADITNSDKTDTIEQYRYYPSLRVQKNLDSLLQELNLTANLFLKEEAHDFSMPKDLKDLSKYEGVDADYIIEVIIPLMGWKASYATMKWRQYHLNLALEVRIIRTKDLKRIWKTNVGYGGLVDKEMRFHINDLDEHSKEMISKKLDVMALESSKKVVANYQKAKK